MLTLKRTKDHRTADLVATFFLACSDLLIICYYLFFGADGVWTADWMGYPGMANPDGASYQG
ncbi:hypothetical protein ACWGB8_12885 [Kitasatospora sp. NPDC054939]